MCTEKLPPLPLVEYFNTFFTNQLKLLDTLTLVINHLKEVFYLMVEVIEDNIKD